MPVLASLDLVLECMRAAWLGWLSSSVFVPAQRAWSFLSVNHMVHNYICPEYGSPLPTISFPRSRVPEEGEKTRRRENERSRKRETNWFSRFLATIIQLKSCAKTRQRGYELLNPRPTQTPVFVPRSRAPPCFVSASLSVSFPRPSLFRLIVLVTYSPAANPRKAYKSGVQSPKSYTATNHIYIIWKEIFRR